MVFPAVKSKIPPMQPDDTPLTVATGPRFMSCGLIDHALPPNARVIDTVALQAAWNEYTRGIEIRAE